MVTLVAERTMKEALSAIAGTWLAFTAAVALAVPQPPALQHLGLGAAVGLVMIVAGFAAVSRCRRIESRSREQRYRVAGLSVLAGVILGGVLLGALAALARVDPDLQARFVDRASEPLWRPWALAFESSLLEEVSFRLFAMSIVAWLVVRFRRRPRAGFLWALAVSSLLFGVGHLPAWATVTELSTSLIAIVLLLNALGGLLFGWIFWYWGLPYAILCHAAGDVMIQSLAPRLL